MYTYVSSLLILPLLYVIVTNSIAYFCISWWVTCAREEQQALSNLKEMKNKGKRIIMIKI